MKNIPTPEKEWIFVISDAEELHIVKFPRFDDTPTGWIVQYYRPPTAEEMGWIMSDSNDDDPPNFWEEAATTRGELHEIICDLVGDEVGERIYRRVLGLGVDGGVNVVEVVYD